MSLALHTLAWIPFLNPLPVWSDRVWPWLLLPLAAGVSVVYKSIKCRHMREVPKEATVILSMIVLSMVAAAIALAVVVETMEKW